MFLSPPPLTKPTWVYEDPSGVAEPSPYLRPWPRRKRTRLEREARRARLIHREV